MIMIQSNRKLRRLLAAAFWLLAWQLLGTQVVLQPLPLLSFLSLIFTLCPHLCVPGSLFPESSILSNACGEYDGSQPCSTRVGRSI